MLAVKPAPALAGLRASLVLPPELVSNEVEDEVC